MSIPADIYLATLVIFVAGVMRGFSGFGSGMILVPSLSLIYDPLAAIITVVLLEIIPIIQMFPKSIRNCHWRTVLPLSLGAVVIIPFASLLLLHADESVMRYSISILVILCVLVLASGWRYQGEATVSATTTTGIVSGLIGGATCMGGLPIVMYYLSTNLSVQVIRASIVVFLVITSIVALVSYSSHDLISMEIFMRCVWMTPVYILAIWFGGSLFGKVSESLFRNLTLVILASAGIALLL